MFCDIAPICNEYRGIERSVDICNFKSRNKRQFKDVIEIYFNYLECCEVPFSKKQISEMIEFAKYFSQNSSDTYEVIIYNDSRICESFGHELLFLGIEVLYCDVESLLLEPNLQPLLKGLKNNFGLLNSVDDIEKILNTDLFTKYGKLQYVWVYTLLN